MSGLQACGAMVFEFPLNSLWHVIKVNCRFVSSVEAAAQGSAGPNRATGVFLNILTSYREMGRDFWAIGGGLPGLGSPRTPAEQRTATLNHMQAQSSKHGT